MKPSCHIQTNQCGSTASTPCQNSGICSEGWNRPICDCSATSFAGPTCGRESATLAFNGSQHMTMWIGGDHGTRTQTEELVFRFKTTKATGLLLVTSADTNSPDRLEISLVAGRVRASVRLGDREKVCNNNGISFCFTEARPDAAGVSISQFPRTRTKTQTKSHTSDLFYYSLFSVSKQNLLAGQGVLNDNNWHTVRFSRKASNLRLQVDGVAPVRGMLCMYQQHIYCPIRVVTCRF